MHSPSSSHIWPKIQPCHELSHPKLYTLYCLCVDTYLVPLCTAHTVLFCGMPQLFGKLGTCCNKACSAVTCCDLFGTPTVHTAVCCPQLRTIVNVCSVSRVSGCTQRGPPLHTQIDGKGCRGCSSIKVHLHAGLCFKSLFVWSLVAVHPL